MSSIYVHIPFCKSRCIYCGFYSTTLLALQEQYIDAVIRELSLRKDYLPSQPIRTLYIGGGTPSLLSHASLSRLCHALTQFAGTFNAGLGDGEPQAIEEFTIECNPDDITEDFARLLAPLGINRVSMGAQTFSDGRLAFLRRRHRSEDVKKAVNTLRKCSIGNVSLDLMFGFPGQTLAEWRHDIDSATGLDVQHISAYSLTYEEGTPLHSLLQKGEVSEIGEEESLAMYDTLIDRLTACGYEHYEISNFALPGCRSKHNSGYWSRIPYLGLGASAHSFDLLSRQWNICDVQTYIRHVTDSSPAFIEEREELTARETYNDTVTTALRTSEGIDILSLDSRFRDHLLAASRRHVSNGTLSLSDNRLRLTRKGLFISDSNMTDLVCVD